MKDRILEKWGEISVKYSGRIILVSMIVIVLSLISASSLKMSMRWSDLLPLQDPMVKEFDHIMNEYTETSNTIIVLKGDEKEMKKFAEKIAPKIEGLDSLVKRVKYKIDMNFFSKHGLMLQKTKDLKNSKDLFYDLNLLPFLTALNDNLEKTYIADENSISDLEKEREAVAAMDGIEYWVKTIEKYIENKDVSEKELQESVQRLTLGDPYYISQDKDMLLIFAEPNFQVTDMNKIISSTEKIKQIINQNIMNFPNITAGLTGTVPLAYDEYQAGMRDSAVSSLLAFALVILLFIIFFKLITAPLAAGINLMLSIIFASGIISLFIDSLNMMTSMFAAILVGLGIDFAIHIIALYTERRSIGSDRTDSMKYTLKRSGSGIITGGLTTSLAFFTLMVSKTRGINEMGLVLGLGILSSMAATIILLPSLLVIREKWIEKTAALFENRKDSFLKRFIMSSADMDKHPKPVQFPFLGKLGKSINNHPFIYLTLVLAFTGFMIYSASTIKFDYNYLNMEPKGIPSVTLQDDMIEKFDMSPDFVMLTVNTVEESREVAEQAKDIKSVGMTSSISEYIPKLKEQKIRQDYIEYIRTRVQKDIPLKSFDDDSVQEFADELNRLDMNIYEMGQMGFIGGQDKIVRKSNEIVGNPEEEDSKSIILGLMDKILESPETSAEILWNFQKDFRLLLTVQVERMSNSDIITLENLPQNIKSRFYNKDTGKFLLTINPKKLVWDFQFLKLFSKQMKALNEKITGLPLMFLRLIELIKQDGKISMLLTLTVIFIILLLDFRNLKLALLAMVPLLAGSVWMIGFLKVLGFKLTFINVIGLPMIIGIGIDDGVHIIHRYKLEGMNKTGLVFRSTGKAILLTSLTTMAGFGSLLIASYRGFVSLGIILVLGVGACFLTTLFFLPSLLGLKKANRDKERE